LKYKAGRQSQLLQFYPITDATDQSVAEALPQSIAAKLDATSGSRLQGKGPRFDVSERVPDERIAMSTPVTQASRTTVPDGKTRFVLFRRDLAENAPDRVEVRVVARVVRALTFDAKGKPGFSAVTEPWNIRNLAYELRVRPIAGNPEMLLVQSEKADFMLPSGRYVLVLKDRGYDFTVAGKVTDVAQCLERTDAAKRGVLLGMSETLKLLLSPGKSCGGRNAGSRPLSMP
jgi:hypothetical protein